MRVMTHGRFNLCPSPVCNPDEGDGGVRGAGAGRRRAAGRVLPVPRGARATPSRRRRGSCEAARLDVGGIEYLETPDGRRVFYDINANSNLRPSVAAAFGFDPFERVVDFLEREVERCRVRGQRGRVADTVSQGARCAPERNLAIFSDSSSRSFLCKTLPVPMNNQPFALDAFQGLRRGSSRAGYRSRMAKLSNRSVPAAASCSQSPSVCRSGPGWYRACVLTDPSALTDPDAQPSRYV